MCAGVTKNFKNQIVAYLETFSCTCNYVIISNKYLSALSDCKTVQLTWYLWVTLPHMESRVK